jgi:lon-related putative ATP-dependent protease
MIDQLKPEHLYGACDLRQFSFQTTDELESLPEIVGQSRVVDAVQFGVGIQQPGYNLYVSGPSGIGKRWTMRHLLQERAAGEPTPPDWCYVNNFVEPRRPMVLQLAPGQGVLLRQDVDRLVQELRSTIPAVFEGDEYRARKQAIEIETKTQQARAFEELSKQAQTLDIGLARTPAGFVFAPLRNGEVIPPEQFNALPEEERKRVEDAMTSVQGKLQAVTHQVMQIEKEGRERLKALTRDVTNFAVSHPIEILLEKYAASAEVVLYLKALQQDVTDNVDQFLAPPEPTVAAWMGGSHSLQDGPPFLRRYRVNVVVDHSGIQGAPLVYEDHPTYQNLIGQAEYVSQLGALSTDFNLIRGGALHRANGGYLMLDAQKVLAQPYAWDGLKRALQSSEIRIESLGEAMGLMSTVSLEPQSITLKVKVILVGDRLLYYLLCQYDAEFSSLFKVVADFDDQMERTPENHLLYARSIATIAQSEKLRPFDRSAVARTIEHGSRLVGDAERLSQQRMALVDLLRESDYWAGQTGSVTVKACDVQKAIDAQVQRASRMRERVLEEIQRGTLLISTSGAKVGQVNGLSVIQSGRFAFGQPNRITARVRLGKGEVVDIEREVELGGPIHSKGVLILSSFLGARYSADRPLSLHASLVFEQSYGGVEGDSASSAELYALLSALSGVPIRQSMAVTGSVNQYGEVQPIGGVNEKIEGFFDVCRAKGANGDEGVAIPASNVKHLMLRNDIVEAVREGRFHIYPVRTIDEGIEILTGVPAGERDESGKFPEGTINYLVEKRMAEFTEEHMAFAASAAAGNSREHPKQ